MLILKDKVIIRKMKDNSEDIDVLFKWFNDKSVQMYYEGKNAKYSKQEIKDKYGKRAREKDSVIPCIIEYSSKPIGYIQYYELDEETKEAYESIDIGRVYGIDMFIGETEYWNKGIGSKSLKSLIRYLFEKEDATSIFIDPQTWNKRAIKCYEKCGFKKVKILFKNELYDDEYKDNLIMKISALNYKNA